jgi:hypothetical protein
MGPSLDGSLGLSCRYKRFLFCLGCSSWPSTKYFFLVVLGRLSLILCVSGQNGHNFESCKIRTRKGKTTSSALLQDVGNYQCVDYDDDELQVDPGRGIVFSTYFIIQILSGRLRFQFLNV